MAPRKRQRSLQPHPQSSKIKEERKYAFEEGREEGREEGKTEEKKETALGMLYDNMPICSIAKYTKLSLDYIRDLAAKHNLTVVE